MSPAIVVPCACCKDLVEPAVAYFEPELVGHVCESCRRDLGWAKAWLGKSESEPADGLPAMPINLREVYRGKDAGDNQPPPTPVPPARDL